MQRTVELLQFLHMSGQLIVDELERVMLAGDAG